MGGLKIVELTPNITQAEEKEWMIGLITSVILENMRQHDDVKKTLTAN